MLKRLNLGETGLTESPQNPPQRRLAWIRSAKTPAQKAARTRQRNKVKAAKKLLKFTIKDHGKPWRRIYEGDREVLDRKTHLGKELYEVRTLLMAARQNNLCGLCGFVMSRPTFDHENGRGMNGGHRDDRIEVEGRWLNAAVCYECNLRKASKRVPYLPHAKRETN